MARERMVTRTVNGYNVTAMTVDTVTAKLENKVFTLGADFKEDKALDNIRKRFETDTCKVVSIVNIDTFEQLYGMSEAYFTTIAKPLPPRGEGGRTRERIVTRTVNGYNVTAMTVDTVTAKLENKVFTLGADYDAENGLKWLRKNMETDTCKVVAIVATNVFEQLYGISEQEFIAKAVKLPPRGTATNEE